MIIRYPTGLYRDALPHEPQDRGNVTFTISNTTPPRTNLLFPKIPIGLVDRGRAKPGGPNPFTGRRHVGELVFTVSGAKRQQIGNNARQYEIGEVLDFTSGSTKAVDPMLVNPVTEIQHNNNLFDYDTLGVSAADQTLIAEQSLIVHTQLTDKLNGLKQKRADTEVDINTQQKLINEITRTITALDIVAKTSPEVLVLVGQLTIKRTAAFVVRDRAVAQANQLAAAADAVLTELRAVAVVLK